MCGICQHTVLGLAIPASVGSLAETVLWQNRTEMKFNTWPGSVVQIGRIEEVVYSSSFSVINPFIFRDENALHAVRVHCTRTGYAAYMDICENYRTLVRAGTSTIFER